MTLLLSLLVVIVSTTGFAGGGCPDCPSKTWLNGYPKPIITQNPSSQIVLRGDKVVLTCKCKSPITVNFLWRKDKKPLELKESKNHASLFINEINDTSSDYPEKEYVHELHLEDVEDSDQGGYVCHVNTNIGHIYSKKARITLHAVPTFTTSPSNVTLRAGQTAKLECSATGQPIPEISWTKDGGYDFPAAFERRMHFMSVDNSFYIVDVKVEDIGVYSCRAKNVAAEVVANATLMVIQEPKFVKPMEDKKSPVGDTAVLECSAAGSPRPKLTWTKNGLPLSLTERHFLTADDQLLVITNVQDYDSGTYSCQISNPLGSVHDSLKLAVTAAASPINWMPFLTIFLILVCLLIFGLVIYLLVQPPLPAKNAHSDQDLDKHPDKHDYIGQTQLGSTPDVADFSIDLDKGDVEL